jgi:hypothetical protein
MTTRICGIDGCRKLAGHSDKHDPYPKSAWSFLLPPDKNKIEKAGYATPRGGAKGAYQNHVVRSNRVIIPYERLTSAPLHEFKSGYVVRLFPDQYFESPRKPKSIFLVKNCNVEVGRNAFLLYRSHETFDAFPPLMNWSIRGLVKDGNPVKEWGSDVVDSGHYILRMPKLGDREARYEGPPQGIFAPEYATEYVNFMARCVLAWLIVHTANCPYTTTQASHIKAILDAEELSTDLVWESKGILQHGVTSCPLCLRLIHYNELHDMIDLAHEESLGNAGLQVEGATRSTIVNLFHMEPLRYDRLDHRPEFVAWGHATCNTKLGQRKCYSMAELQNQGLKIGIIADEGIETFGWMSENWEFIRSPDGSAWIRIAHPIAH